MNVLFKSIRNTRIKTSRRKRQCFSCMCLIKKGDLYGNHEFRYDFRIITISFCPKCYTEYYLKYNKINK